MPVKETWHERSRRQLTRLLIVDDDREIANLIRIYIDNEGYECEVAYDGEEALQLLRSNHYDLVV